MILQKEYIRADEIAAAVKQRRLRRNITQQELAERSGVPLPSIRLFEQKGRMSLTSFIKILRVLEGAEKLYKALKEDDIAFKTMDDLLASQRIKPKKRARKND